MSLMCSSDSGYDFCEWLLVGGEECRVQQPSGADDEGAETDDREGEGGILRYI